MQEQNAIAPVPEPKETPAVAKDAEESKPETAKKPKRGRPKKPVR